MSEGAVGQQLTKYRLVRPLGGGGFGEVWEAENTLPLAGEPERVAVKLLREQRQGAFEALKREAELQRSLIPLATVLEPVGMRAHALVIPSAPGRPRPALRCVSYRQMRTDAECLLRGSQARKWAMPGSAP